MACILIIAIATVCDLENRSHDPKITRFVEVASLSTTLVFTCECVLKIVAEAHKPHQYFVSNDDGPFNCFDFSIVVLSYAFMGSAESSAIGGLRLLRLIRLLTFVKNVPQLRVIIVGLITGLRSVVYIVMLLFLLIYIFSIMGCVFFGLNDPFRFGTLPLSMLTLFTVSVQSGWSDIAYVGWYGCQNFVRLQEYGPESHSTLSIHSTYFPGFVCDVNDPKPTEVFVFFSSYIVLTSWCIMSLFIGVISMGMFEAFEEDEKESRHRAFAASLHEYAMNDIGMTADEVTQDEPGGSMGEEKDGWQKKAKKRWNRMKERIDDALAQNLKARAAEKMKKLGAFDRLARRCRAIEQSMWFSTIITLMILVIGVYIGIDTEREVSCERFRVRHVNGDPAKSPNCGVAGVSSTVEALSQVIFTLEAAVKVVGNGQTPWRYFNDAWNRLDFVIILVGWLELTPAESVLSIFPLKTLRLLRLLRVFRLAPALPRLQRIVESLIASLSSVGWIVILIVVCNFVLGCSCMLMFQSSDPFH